MATTEERFERLERALDREPRGSDRRNAIKHAMFRLVYDGAPGEMRWGYGRLNVPRPTLPRPLPRARTPRMHTVVLEDKSDSVLIHLADGRRVVVQANRYATDEVIVELRGEDGMYDSRVYAEFRNGGSHG